VTQGLRPRFGTWVAFLPLLGWQLIFYAVPFGVLALASVWRLQGNRLVADWTLDNYVQVFSRTFYVDAWLESLSLTLTLVVTVSVIGYAVAYAITFGIAPRWQPVILVAMVAPFWTNYLIRAYGWSMVLGGSGPVNGFLQAVGVIAQPMQLLYTPLATRIGLTHFLSVVMALFVYARMASIDRRLLEAAADLGASRWQAFREVTLPLSVSALKTALAIVIVWGFADYVTPAVLGGQNPRVFAQLVVDAIQRNANWTLGASFAAVMVLSILLFSALVGRIPAPRSQDL
jgi:spermidine/putrescine transport system permease protein